MKKCPFCAEEIQDEAILCRYCGRELQIEGKPIGKVQKAQPKNSNPLIIGIFLVIVLCVALFRRGDNSSTPPETTAVKELVSANSVVTSTPEATNTPAGTNTPRPTRTLRPTAIPEVGTLTNPYLYGTKARLEFTSLGKRSEFTIQVLNVLRGDDANSIVRNANMFNDEPPAGASWMLVQVEVTLTDGSAFTLNSYELAIISGGQIFGGFDFSVCCTEEMGFSELDANIALPGTSVEGWVIRPVILTDEKPLLALGINDFQPDLDDGIFLALHP